MLYRLHVNLRTKLLVAGIFTLCSATICISAARIWATVALQGTLDLTWNTSISNSLLVCESNLTIVCGSVMVLRPFCRRHLPFLLDSSARKSGHSGESPGNNAQGSFDGPMGPRTKSGYLAKVSGGGQGTRSKRSLWAGLGNTLVKEEDDDLESLSKELKAYPRDATATAGVCRIGDMGVRRSDVGGDAENRRFHEYEAAMSERSLNEARMGMAIGVARSGTQGEEMRFREESLGQGIMRTVSLDVR